MEETAEASSPTSCSQQSQLWNCTMSFKVLSSLALKTSKDGANTMSLGSFFQCVTFFILKKIFFIIISFASKKKKILSSHGVVSLTTHQAVQLTVYPDFQVLFSCSWASQFLTWIRVSNYLSQIQDFILNLDEFHKVLTAHSSSLSSSIQIVGLTSRI